jgi:uncharacterized membrane-anchored protein
MKACRFAVFTFFSLLSTQLYAQDEALSEEDQAYVEWAQTLWDSIEQQTGDITLPGNVATLDVPDTFYYLNQSDTKKVLTEIWGNPPGSAEGVLGMIFPAESTPFDNGSWGVTIEYVQEGYVSDENADDIDYSELLAQMKSDTADSSILRVEQGYDPISLIGWASPPFYDKNANKLHWAKEIKFGQNDIHTLNYNIRILGRKGVLVLNFIASIDQLEDIDNQLDSVLAIAEFKEGSRYADFNPDIDDVATYGLGALIAGKVAAKTGLLAAAFLFLKKFGILIVIGIGAFFKKIFTGRKSKSDAESS